uniref:Domain of unknown function DB domain-containing protein n=1 Tax=Caenorhabditis japonica TaxID=281687 RepID=A0A8R1IM14_CAEJA
MENRFLLQLLLLVPIVLSNISGAKIERAAKKCCTKSRQACCQDFLVFGKPIGCSFDQDAKIPKIVYDCLQGELFDDEPEKRMSFHDFDVLFRMV